jgi:hypothetical protein
MQFQYLRAELSVARRSHVPSSRFKQLLRFLNEADRRTPEFLSADFKTAHLFAAGGIQARAVPPQGVEILARIEARS